MLNVGCEISPFILTHFEPIGDCGVGFNTCVAADVAASDTPALFDSGAHTQRSLSI